jgi:hypothetical protein
MRRQSLRSLLFGHVCILSAFSVHSVSHASAISTFTSDSESWAVVDFSFPTSGNPPPVLQTYIPTWNGSGGNPGGFISQADPSSDVFYFSAPATFLGNQADVYGQILSFDVTDDLCCSDNALPSVIVVGTTMTLYAAAVPAPSTWSSRNVLLVGNSFRINSPGGALASDGDLLNVLSNVQAIYLVGDWISGIETAGLDNVFMPLQPTAAQPSTWGSLKATIR